MNQYLAHSAGKDTPVLPQEYSVHVSNVVRSAGENVSGLAPYYVRNIAFLREALQTAAIFHDLGKLDEDNQRMLAGGGRNKLPVNHVDAGTAHLDKHKLVEAAFLVYSHHIGLQSIPQERAKAEYFLRDPETFDRTETCLDEYLSRHNQSFNKNILTPLSGSSDWNGLTRRIALSCLVDADHGDTAQNYRREFQVQYPDRRWEDRLESLVQYVEGLYREGDKNERNKLRQEIFEACLNADKDPSMYTCDSPVGTGKTTAVMAHLLKTAIDKNLRHIIVVLPYTNIIKQSVDVYRKAMVLTGEEPEDVVTEHHHQADFEDIEIRQLSTLWKAPIIVTTAVQFFETIASNQTSKLRKLHELIGSAIFVDETHAAIPTPLWPQTWEWLKDLAQNWGCHFVFASGSLPRFWELRDLMEVPAKLPDLVGHELRERANKLERRRILPERHPTVLNIEDLMQLVLNTPGPRLIIMNTVQSAAVVADWLAKRVLGPKYTVDVTTSPVLHLSTSLAPIDREEIFKAVELRLNSSIQKGSEGFTLVATSCVEAGVDFSFRSAFRERAGAANLIQIGGRVRRHSEDFDPKLIDFKVRDSLINRNPTFDLPGQVLEKLFDEGRVTRDSPTDLVTEAMRRELMSATSTEHETIIAKERDMDYPSVARQYRVIAEDTIPVLIDEDLKKRLCQGAKIDPREVNRKSVRVWKNSKFKTLAKEIPGFPGLFSWDPEGYDRSFLGYMKGALPMIQMEAKGFTIS